MASTPEVDALPTQATLGQLKEFIDGIASAVKAHEANKGAHAFEHEQAVAETTWTVTHNLNARPTATVVDGAGRVVDAAVEYLNENQLVVFHNTPETGKVLL